VDVQAEQANAVEYDAVVVPGGFAPDLMRRSPAMVKLVREAFQQGKVVAAICHAGWMPVSAGITAVMVFSIGGIIGACVQGPIMNALGVFRTIVGEFVASLALVMVASVIFANFALMMVVTFILGVIVQGAQAGLNVLSAMYYPTVIRSTGVGWALGVGRIGSIVGPFIGGVMLSLQWTPQQIFMAGAVPAICAAAAVVASGYLQGRTSPFHPDTEPAPVAAH